MQWIFNLSSLATVAANIYQLLQADLARIILLDGPMGSGKTTFTQAFVASMGSTDTVNSPTFSIINHYQLPDGNPVYHMDLYRLKNTEDAINAGVEDALYSRHWCLVEWPGIVHELLPDGTHTLSFEVIDTVTRKITLI